MVHFLVRLADQPAFVAAVSAVRPGGVDVVHDCALLRFQGDVVDVPKLLELRQDMGGFERGAWHMLKSWTGGHDNGGYDNNSHTHWSP